MCKGRGVVLFAVGSAVIVDVEESLDRAGLHVEAGISNHPGPSYLSKDSRIFGLDALEAALFECSFLVPLFTPLNRYKVATEARQLGFKLPLTLIDPTSITPRRLEVGPGSYINAGCSIGAMSALGEFAFVNRGASIGHHARFGPFVSIGPGAVIAGNVTIGAHTMVGAGATILPGLTLGDDALIGAGSVVVKDVPSGSVVIGNPARSVRRNEQAE